MHLNHSFDSSFSAFFVLRRGGGVAVDALVFSVAFEVNKCVFKSKIILNCEQKKKPAFARRQENCWQIIGILHMYKNVFLLLNMNMAECDKSKRLFPM